VGRDTGSALESCAYMVDRKTGAAAMVRRGNVHTHTHTRACVERRVVRGRDKHILL